jgi:hypothetical protein
VFVPDPKEIAYYDVGKVFRFRNITSAVAGNLEDNPYNNKKANLCFHIFSQAGRLS